MEYESIENEYDEITGQLIEEEITPESYRKSQIAIREPDPHLPSNNVELADILYKESDLEGLEFLQDVIEVEVERYNIQKEQHDRLKNILKSNKKSQLILSKINSLIESNILEENETNKIEQDEFPYLNVVNPEDLERNRIEDEELNQHVSAPIIKYDLSMIVSISQIYDWGKSTFIADAKDLKINFEFGSQKKETEIKEKGEENQSQLINESFIFGIKKYGRTPTYLSIKLMEKVRRRKSMKEIGKAMH